jgi:type II secretory pathway predicted ATPase ExeA
VLLDALAPPGVLVIDDVQRIAAPELDYLRLLADAPTTHTSLVLHGQAPNAPSHVLSPRPPGS